MGKNLIKNWKKRFSKELAGGGVLVFEKKYTPGSMLSFNAYERWISSFGWEEISTGKKTTK